jgi:hypothetical protein
MLGGHNVKYLRTNCRQVERNANISEQFRQIKMIIIQNQSINPRKPNLVPTNN